jgi:hypothetical protein
MVKDLPDAATPLVADMVASAPSDYRGRRHGRLHSPRAERMTENSPVTPIAISVQTKKKCPLELPMLLVTPTPFPFMWTMGTINEKSLRAA